MSAWLFATALCLVAALPAPKDYDKDGIADVDDDCPTDPGHKSNRGCPGEVKQAPPPPPKPAKVQVKKDRLDIQETIKFKTGSAKVDPSSYLLLQEIAASIQTLNPLVRVSIEGHTDNRGSRRLNLKLSKARAHSVMEQLVLFGVQQQRLSAQGFGPDRALASNRTAAGRAKNRRVEFILKK